MDGQKKLLVRTEVLGTLACIFALLVGVAYKEGSYILMALNIFLSIFCLALFHTGIQEYKRIRECR